MAVTIKNEEEIALMREAGKILAGVHEELGKQLHEGMSTKEVDRICEALIREKDCIPSFLGYEGYPASACVSLNDEVVHGIPREDRIIKYGDVVSLDIGVIYKGYQSDAARTHIIGDADEAVKQLVKVTQESFFAGIKYAKAGNYLHDISNAIDAYIRPYRYGIVRELTGHGIGKDMHEEPSIPNFHRFTKGVRLEKGMTLAIEPMVNLGTRKVAILDDDWTIVTQDGKVSAHYENTVLITDGEPEILSLL